MARPWTEKHRPRTLDGVAGNPQLLSALRAWADSWEQGRPTHKAALIAGPPGCGKTSAAWALASERGWDVVELNASDARSAPAIRRVAGEGSVSHSFSSTGEFQSAKAGRRKLILLDEADNLYERPGEAGEVGGQDFSDRGGKRAMVETVLNTRQPVVLIANDAYAVTKGGGERLSKALLRLAFRRVPAAAVKKVLLRVAAQERVQVSEEVLGALAARSDGDIRSALNDLEAAAVGRTRVDSLGGLTGERNRSETIFNALETIYRSGEARAAIDAARNLDEEPSFLLLWLDENLPGQLRDARRLEAAYGWLARADVYLGRTQRRQNYGLWSYATEIMSAGVAVSAGTPGGGSLQFPGWLRRMAGSRGDRNVRQALARKLGAAVHAGGPLVVREFLPLLSVLAVRDRAWTEDVGLRLDLEADEIRCLLGARASEEYADEVVRQVEARRSRGGKADREFFSEVPPAPQPERDRPAAPKSKSLLDY